MKKTLNIMKAMSMSQLDKLSFDKDFELPFSDGNNNKLLNGEDKQFDDEIDDPSHCRGKQFVKSGLFRKSIDSITNDCKRREDGLNRIRSRSVNSLVVSEERRKEVLENIKRIGQYHDAAESNTQGDKKIKFEKISQIRIEDDSDAELMKIEDSSLQENRKKLKQKKEREWDQGKVFDEDSGVWLTKGIERTSKNSRDTKSSSINNRSSMREWDKGKTYNAEAGQWNLGDVNVRSYRKSKHPMYFLHDIIDEEDL